MAVLIHGTPPDYTKLKCPKCGNTDSFLEYAFRPTSQRFNMGEKGNRGRTTEPNWQEFDWSDDVFVEQISCGECEDATVVWKATAKSK